MRKKLCIACALFAAVSAFAQPYGNEWINYDQIYYEFPIVSDGVYRIDYQTLIDAGIPIAAIDPQNIQLFGRQEECFIFISGEEDGVFDVGDYIEFYAEGNDGWLDTAAYETAEAQNNPHYSLYNDTATYYLTWNNSTSNRRMKQEEDVDFDSYSPVDYFWMARLTSFTSDYFNGYLDANGLSVSTLTAAEGWLSPRFGKGNKLEVDVVTTNAYTSPLAPPAEVLAVSASNSNAGGQLTDDHHLQVRYGSQETIVVDTIYSGYQLNKFVFSIPNAALESPSTKITHQSIDDIGAPTDFHSVSYVELKYPHNFDVENVSSLVFELPFNTLEEKSYVNFSNFDAANALLLDLTDTVKRIPTVFNAGSFQALIPNQLSGSSLCYLTSASEIKSVTSLNRVSPSGQFTNFANLEIDSAFLIVTHSSLLTAANAYATYKSLAGYNTLVVDVDELYHQFAGGIPKHAIGIRRFADYLLDNWSSPAQYLFIIGKSVREANEGADPGSRKSIANYQTSLVPSFGYPPSDNLFTVGLNGTLLQPAIKTGRLSASSEEQVMDYLEKVMQKESASSQEWMKRVIHFGGGATEDEQITFASFLSNYENLIEDTCYGGFVHTFLKNTSLPIQINLSDSIQDLINNGVALMTFFGHASSSGFDQNIDLPANYNNEGKYPFLVANSCFTGDIHQPTTASASESWVLIPNKGVLGFLASVKLGISSYLNIYTQAFYRSLSQQNYGESIGAHMANSVAALEQINPNNFYVKNTAYSFTLQGDPSLAIYDHEKPDFSVQADRIFFSPEEVTTDLDSFDVNVILTNLGKATNQSFGVELVRHYPENQADSSYLKEVDRLYFKDTLSFRLPVDASIGGGLNQFEVFVDYPTLLVDELDNVGNNIVSNKDLLITTGGLIPVYPYQYAIVPEQEVVLKASTGNAFAEEKTYVFQIDTTDGFDSPWLQTASISSSAGVLSWTPALSLTDSLVCFWRVSPESDDPDDYQWRESSFQYIPGRRGWGQAHFGQFKNNQFDGIEYNTDEEQFNFLSGSKTMFCNVYGNASTTEAFNGTYWKLDIEWQDGNGCTTNPAIHVAVVDSITFEAWGTYGYIPGTETFTNEDHQFGNANNGLACRSRVEKYFVYFQNNADQMLALDNLLNNEIPDGHYVLIYTWRYVNYDGWDAHNPDLYATFAALGADSIGVAKDSVPFIFAVKKGFPETAQEVYGATIDDFLTFSYPLQATGDQGFIKTPILGPAEEWQKLYWDEFPEEVLSDDSTVIAITGMREDASMEILASYASELDSADLSFVDAAEFPYLKLDAFLQDRTQLTPAQLDRWQVLYDWKPEAALNANAGYYFHDDTLQEGEQVGFAVTIENISEFDMDSLLVSYWIEDKNRQRRYISYQRQDSLRAGEVLYDTLYANTLGLGGQNFFWVEVNPIDTATGAYDQLEQYHFNNIGIRKFFVQSDRENPLLDVTFDGIHIIDGEVVSAKPQINITLKDENEFLLMDEDADTSNFAVWLTDPLGVQQRIYFSNGVGQPIMNWQPVAGPGEKFQISFQPNLLKDGLYGLLVQASDKSGNESGLYDYKVHFEVVNQSSITNVLNYPNPFSTRTQFVFTLTGSELPTQMQIQILTVSGKVVREISMDEIGPLRIGRNRTEYWWDGRDQFGDQLANGIYLYRVRVKINGSPIEHRETSASQYFNRGFGKMYLMR